MESVCCNLKESELLLWAVHQLHRLFLDAMNVEKSINLTNENYAEILEFQHFLVSYGKMKRK